MKAIIFFFLASIALVSSQYIVTSTGYDQTLMYTYEHVQQAFNTKLLDILKTDATIPDLKSDILSTSGFAYSSVSSSWGSSYGNMKTGLYLFSPNKLEVIATFSYITAAEPGKTKSAQLDFSIFNLKVKLAPPKANLNDVTPAAPTTIKLRKNDINIFGASTPDDQSNLKTLFVDTIINDSAQDIIKKMQNSIEKSIVTYYQEYLASKSNISFTLSSFFGGRTATISNQKFIGFCEDVQGTFEHSVCYYSGSANGEIDATVKKDALTFEEFLSPAEGTKITFVHYKVWNDIIKNISAESRVSLTLDKNTLTPPLSFELNYATLKQVYKIHEGTFEDADEVSFISEIESVQFKPDLKGTIAINSFVKIKDTEKVMTITTTHDFEVSLGNKEGQEKLGFNLFIRSLKWTSEGVSGADIIDTDKEKLYRNEIFQRGVGTVYFAESKIPLRDYYKFISIILLKGNGIYIIGKPLYQ